MRGHKYLLFCLIFVPCLVWGAETITPPVTFGGVDRANVPTEVADNRAVDCQNVVGDIVGAVSKRNGSERYITQAVSTNPITSLYRASVDVGTYTRTALIMATSNSIYVSTGDIAPVWRQVRGGLVTQNQSFSFTNFNGQIVMTGDALTDPVFRYRVLTDSFTGLFDSVPVGTTSVRLRAKFAIARDGHLLLANVADIKDESLNNSTTYYGSRVYYNLISEISSFTFSRFINIKTDDGESITGVTDKGFDDGSQILFYKPRSITSLTYSVLNLTIFGGDINVATVVNGFGCISPKALVNAGEFDIVPTFDGIILYNGGRKTRLNLVDEVRPISTLIKSDYERTIKNNTYEKSVAVYYPKKQWYVWSWNDPQLNPSGRANRVYILDLRTGEWYPQKNWLASSFTTLQSDGSLMYGDSNDGYVYKADLETRNDDASKEISLDNMDSTVTWKQTSTRDAANKVEGEASVSFENNFANNYFSSITKMALINFGEWYDKTLVSRASDFISFKLRVSSVSVSSYVRVDLQFGDAISSFTTRFTSVTLTSFSLVNDYGLTEGSFLEIRIRLSSFPIPATWTEIGVEEVPFADNNTIYGVRFVAEGISTSTFKIDDLRIVQSGKNIIEAFYLSKLWNLGTMQEKDWRQIILSRDKASDSSFNLDIFTDFGYFANSKKIGSRIPKEIMVFSHKGNEGIAKLSSKDFSVLGATLTISSAAVDYMNGTANKDFIFAFDKAKHRLVMLDRSTLSVIVSTIGSLGSGATNFDTVNQMSLVDNSLFVCDTFNSRIVHILIKNKKMTLVRTFGEVGRGATNFFSPGGITADKTHIWILDEGNTAIKKFTHDFKFVDSAKLETNTIPAGSLQNEGNFLYVAYNVVANEPVFQDVILEKRNKGDMSILQRNVLRSKDDLSISTYTLAGDFALLGKYLFIGFTKDLLTTGTYYVQKMLKDGFELVDEYSTPKTQFSIVGDAESYLPTIQSEKVNLEARNGTYIQLKFYDKEEDNTFRLLNYAFALDAKSYQEQPR